jgi:hypothetical protein
MNDQTIADALCDAASNWLWERGLKTMRGPLSFSVNDEAGLLIDAFDEPPLIRSSPAQEGRRGSSPVSG